SVRSYVWPLKVSGADSGAAVTTARLAAVRTEWPLAWPGAVVANDTAPRLPSSPVTGGGVRKLYPKPIGSLRAAEAARGGAASTAAAGAVADQVRWGIVIPTAFPRGPGRSRREGARRTRRRGVAVRSA